MWPNYRFYISFSNRTRKFSLSSPYDSEAKAVNRRSVLAMRVAGRGLASLETFVGSWVCPHLSLIQHSVLTKQTLPMDASQESLFDSALIMDVIT